MVAVGQVNKRMVAGAQVIFLLKIHRHDECQGIKRCKSTPPLPHHHDITEACDKHSAALQIHGM